MLACLSTDAPATTWVDPSNPFICIKGAVTRKVYDGNECGKEEFISVEAAIKIYTKNAAIVSGFTEVGMLRKRVSCRFCSIKG